MPGLERDRKVLATVLMEVPLCPSRGLRPTRDDFGPGNGEGLQLRRRGLNYDLTDPPGAPGEYFQYAFGIWAGRMPDDKYYVVQKDFVSFLPVGFHTYETMADVHRDWELD